MGESDDLWLLLWFFSSTACQRDTRKVKVAQYLGVNSFFTLLRRSKTTNYKELTNELKTNPFHWKTALI